MGLLFTIIGDIFSPTERGRYVGLFSAVWGVASIFGPTLGGWLTDQWSWRACFWVNLPVGAIAVAAIYFEFPHLKPRAEARRIDWLGFVTLSRLRRAVPARADMGAPSTGGARCGSSRCSRSRRSCSAPSCSSSRGRPIR